MRQQNIFIGDRLITVNKTLVEIEDYLRALADELAITTLSIEEKMDILATVSRACENIGQLRSVLNKRKKQS